ncbi:hypothetical protein K501DRAFT_313021 [Backusella circina FSU 941]|nr:hypothetical protein K501DRAFT_313021 [Backusella circina FSU 941]
MDFTNYKPALECYPEDDIDMDDRMDVEDLAFQYGEISKLVDIDTVLISDFGSATCITKRQSERLDKSICDHWVITVIEIMDRVPPHYFIKNKMEVIVIVLSEPSSTCTYSNPTLYTRGPMVA